MYVCMHDHQLAAHKPSSVCMYVCMYVCTVYLLYTCVGIGEEVIICMYEETPVLNTFYIQYMLQYSVYVYILYMSR